MNKTHINNNPHPDDVVDTLATSVEDTWRRLSQGLGASALSAEIRSELVHLSSETAPIGPEFAMRACAVLGAALVDGAWTAAQDQEFDDYVDDRIDDLLATVSSLIGLIPGLGRKSLADSARRLLTAASALPADDFAEVDYLSDLFLATADAIALAVTNSSSHGWA